MPTATRKAVIKKAAKAAAMHNANVKEAAKAAARRDALIKEATNAAAMRDAVYSRYNGTTKSREVSRKFALVIRSVVWNAVHTSTVVPAQEAKAAAQLEHHAKQITIGTGKVSESSCQNQNTSAGLWMNEAARARARLVQKNKKEAEAKALETKMNAAIKRGQLAAERATLFKEYTSRIQGQGIEAIDDPKTKASELVKILQHLGMRPVDMPDKTRETSLRYLRSQPEIVAITGNSQSGEKEDFEKEGGNEEDMDGNDNDLDGKPSIEAV
eukprot:CAMPEP_0185723370 /NCGR_PEP_ID=MMETSP1171-20130828/233_1 /TAXON_ID=374046 /ORGANISM="Helicotheca tamensis, Strain CCMP826" /LENGTH=269 /DNA_ID=CAMNT_0028391063 /DNA_START=73 /DNA_END=882 /DNA_ORIENTATION=+